MTKNNSKILYHFLAFATVAIWGVTFISTKVLINEGMGPAHIFAIRFVIAYAGIWALQLGIKANIFSLRLWTENLKDELLMLFLGITGGSFYFLAENTALAYTQACNVSFLVCSAPLITLLLTMAFRRVLPKSLADGLQKVRGGAFTIAGTILALAGMGLIIFDGAKLAFSLKGDLLALVAALTWGLYSVFMGQMTCKYGAIFTTRKVFFYGLLTIIPFLIGQPVDISVLSKGPVICNLLFLSLVASLGCFVVWNKVMSVIGNVTSTNYVYLNPFFTLLAAIIFLDEKMTLAAAFGSAVLFIGVFITEKGCQQKNDYLCTKH